MSDQTTGAAVSDYDAIGGGPAVSAVVTDFYERVLGDPQLAPYFEGSTWLDSSATRCSW
jgi:truncated hemoglobin YjbI